MQTDPPVPDSDEEEQRPVAPVPPAGRPETRRPSLTRTPTAAMLGAEDAPVDGVPAGTPAPRPARPAASSGAREPTGGGGGGGEDRDVPSWDGSLGTWNNYKRRVSIWESATTLAPERRAPKLLLKLSDTAWESTGSIDVAALLLPRESDCC